MTPEFYFARSWQEGATCLCSVLISKEVCNTSERSPTDDNYHEIQSDAESHLPSDVLDKKLDQACCWFFKMALVVGEEHTFDETILPKIVEDAFKAHDEYRKIKLSKSKVTTFSLQTAHQNQVFAKS